MPYQTAVPGQEVASVLLNQFADSFNGASGKTIPANLVGSDINGWLVALKNLNAASQALIIYKANGTILGQFDASGFRYSPDGSAQGLTPVSTTGAETLTNKTLQSMKWVVGSNIASASTIDPSAAAITGNLHVVTGTATINAIVATGQGGKILGFKFSSAGATVKNSGTLQLAGDYVSLVNSTLVLFCDGTNWIELARSGNAPLSCRLRLGVGGQAFSTNSGAAGTAVSWASADWNDGPAWAIGNPTRLAPGNTGRYVVEFAPLWTANASGWRRAWLRTNGNSATDQPIQLVPSTSATYQHMVVGRGEVYLTAATDYVEIMAAQDGAANLVLVGGGQGSFATFRRVAS